MLGRPRTRVLVLGARDVGKSTFALALLSAAREAGERAALLDCDVGQKMVGPPACVTLGRLRPGGGLDLAGLAFVDATDPVRGWRSISAGAQRLASGSRAGLLVINTGGLLAGPGRRLKAAKAAALAPDMAVALGDDVDLEALLQDLAGIPVLRLAPSARARRKTEGERRAARQSAFARYFATAREARAPLAAFSDDHTLAEPPQMRSLLGLVGGSGRVLGLGIVVGVSAHEVRYLAPPLRGAVALLRGGALVLDESFRERRRPSG